MPLKKFRIFVALACGFVLFLLLGVHLTVKADGDTVYVIPIEETVEKGLSKFLERSFQEAEDMNAKHIILDINTPGGAVDAVLDMADTIHNSDIPVTAYVNRRALSAGAYLALNADDIYMAPGGKMGVTRSLTRREMPLTKSRNRCGWLKWKTRPKKRT